MSSNATVWTCQVGVLGDLRHLLPAGADEPMREAVERRFARVLGMPAEFTFSGWGDPLPEKYLAVVEDREPDPAKVTREVPYFPSPEMVEAVARTFREGDVFCEADWTTLAEQALAAIGLAALDEERQTAEVDVYMDGNHIGRAKPGADRAVASREEQQS